MIVSYSIDTLKREIIDTNAYIQWATLVTHHL